MLMKQKSAMGWRRMAAILEGASGVIGANREFCLSKKEKDGRL